MAEINEFVSITNKIKAPVVLSEGDFKVSGKSLLGAIYTMEWVDIWCECPIDIYTQIEKFVV
jgi:hypothetical protein